MYNKIVGILAGILLILPLGLVNTAVAHTGSNDTIPSPNRADYVYSTNLNVPCSTGGWNQTSSSDLGGDADGDAICDGWELSTGLLIAFKPPAGKPGAGQNFTYSYPCGVNPGQDPQCPSRDHKDVYVELDWMEDPGQSHDPLDSSVVQGIKNAWAAAPVSNPDGTTGIRLHVQYGEWPAAGSAYQKGDIQWHKDLLYTNWSSQTAYPGFYRLKQHTFGTMDERFAAGGASYAYNGTFQKNPSYTLAAVKNPLTAKFQIFHYALIINQRQETAQSTSSGWAEIYGNDHVWSLGGWTPVMGNASVQKAVFMHELGHNFNIDHGGENNTITYKPNYFSVMNPMFQFESPDPCRPLDYSTQAMSTLNENSLSEPAGVKNAAGNGGYLYPSSSPCQVGTERFFWYNTTTGSGLDASDRTNQAVNWNNAAPIDTETELSRSINLDNTKQTLTSRNDWTDLKFDFGLSAFSSGAAAGDLPDADAAPTYLGDDCPDVPSDIAEETPMFAQSFTTGCRELTAEGIPTAVTPGVTPEGEEDEVGPILPPLQQERQGVQPENVICKNGLVLMLKITNHAACVTPDTAEKLVLRGWGNIL